ncbi:MAG: hypothetical protein AAFR68_08255 [Pseudomonadota bacterium]
MTKPTGWLIVALYSRPSTAVLLEAIEQAKEWGHEPPEMTNNKSRIAWLAKCRQDHWNRKHAEAKKPGKPKFQGTITASEVNAFLQTLPDFDEGQ